MASVRTFVFDAIESFCVWYFAVCCQEDLGTEYLIQPVGRAEDEEDASDFEPNNESDVDEDIDDEEEEEEANDDDAGRVEASSKRRRPSTDGAVRNGEDDDDERPSKR